MESKTFTTRDIGIAAYILMNGFEIISANRGSSGKFSFTFKDPKGQAEIYKMQYINSNCAKFDNALRNLKSLCYSGKRS